MENYQHFCISKYAKTDKREKKKASYILVVNIYTPDTEDWLSKVSVCVTSFHNYLMNHCIPLYLNSATDPGKGKTVFSLLLFSHKFQIMFLQKRNQCKFKALCSATGKSAEILKQNSPYYCKHLAEKNPGYIYMTWYSSWWGSEQAVPKYAMLVYF